MKSILMIGQSNMAGRGFINEVPMICNERIQMLRNGRWQMMTEPINYDRPVAGVGLSGSFASMWCMENESEKIGLIPCAEGGSSIDEWLPDCILFRNAITQTKFALENSQLIGILWHQGENDSFGGRYKNYYEKLKIIVDAFRKELDDFDIPFIVGGLGDYLGKSGFGLNCTEYELINKELLRFAKENENTYFVSAENLKANPDGIHINAVSQRKFGVRYYKAFSERRNILSELDNEDELLNLCINKPYTKEEKTYLNILDFSLGNIDYNKFIENLGDIQKG